MHLDRWLRHGDPYVTLRQAGVAPADRIWRWVDKLGPVPAYRPDLGPCWLWTVSTNTDGYGDIQAHGKHLLPHRLAYESLVGPIPAGTQLDHLCRVRRCCNPAHLEPVTGRENNARSESVSAQNLRKTHCLRGHAFDPANTHITPEGHRRCRACMRMHAARYRRASTSILATEVP